MTVPETTPPRWITPFLLVASVALCLTTLAALWTGWKKAPDHHGGPVADITVNLGGQPVREHCTSCHVAGGRVSPENPPHPDIAPHSIESLGCTGCHLGEGMALDERISHGLPGFGARQVLKGKDLQGSCFRCHRVSSLPGAEKAWRGYLLFREKACDGCHHIDGLDQGGRFGPDLSALGSKRGLDRIVEAIRDPRKDPPNSIMPRFPLSRGEVTGLAYFLKSRVEDPFHATPMQVRAGQVPLPEIPFPTAPRDEEQGADLLARVRCLACHLFGEEDGRIAPDLSYIGAQRPAEYIETFLENPARLIPGAIMPPLPMKAEERRSLLELLAREAVGPVQTHGVHGTTPEPAKDLYMALCQRCHAAAGDGHGPIAPNLAVFPRPFTGNVDFFRRAPDERLRAGLEKGVSGTSMPPYGNLLSQKEREMVLDLVFAAFVGTTRADKAALEPLPVRPATLPPPNRIAKLFIERCSRCHGRAGTGRGEEAAKHLTRPRNLGNAPYFAARGDDDLARAVADGVPGTAMPAFREILSPGDLWGLVDGVRSMSGTTGEEGGAP